MSTGRGRRRSRLRSAVLVFASAALLVGLVPGAGPARAAGASGEIGRVTSELAQLEQQISAQRAALARSQARLNALAARLHQARLKYRQTQEQLVKTKDELAAARAQYLAVRARLSERAAAAYMEGPGSGLDIALNATSLHDMMDRLQFMDSLSASDAQLEAEAERLAGVLTAKSAKLRELEHQQASLVAELDREKQALAKQFAQQQAQLQALAHSRSQLLQLVTALGQQQMQTALSSFGGADVTTYGNWARLFLHTLHAPACTRNLVVMVAWQAAENTQARWNPLATTLPMPGSTEFNSVGVQNYTSLSQGVQATILTLKQGASSYGYGPVMTLLIHCAPARATAAAINASLWCHGCANGGYVIDLIVAVESYFRNQHG